MHTDTEKLRCSAPAARQWREREHRLRAFSGAVLLIGLSLPCLPAVALAAAEPPPGAGAGQAGDLERARAEFRRGLSLEASGNWSAALAAFEAVGRVRLTPQVRFHIARCQQHLGRLNEALGEYRVAEYEARSQALPELTDIAAARVELETQIPTIVITLSEPTAAGKILLDGTQVGEAQLGKRLRVDPGSHRVELRLRDGTHVEQLVTLEPAQSRAVVLQLPPKPAQPAAGTAVAGTAVAGSPAAGSAAPPAMKDEAGEATGTPVWPWVLAGVGAAGVAAGAILFVQRAEAEQQLAATCIQGVCPQSLEYLQKQGELYSVLAPVALGVGVAAVGTAVVLLVVDPGSTTSASAGFQWVVVPGYQGLQFRGQF